MNQRSRLFLLLLGALLLLSPASVWAGDHLTGERELASCCESEALVACVLARCQRVESNLSGLFEVERKLAGSAVPRNLVLGSYYLHESPRQMQPLEQLVSNFQPSGPTLVSAGKRYLIFVLATKNKLWSPGITSESAIFPGDSYTVAAAELALKERRKPFLPSLDQLKREHFFDEQVFVARENLSPGPLLASQVQLQYFPRAKLPSLPFLTAASKPSDFVLVAKVKKGELLTVMDVRRVTNLDVQRAPSMSPGGIVGVPRQLMQAEALAYIKAGMPERALAVLKSSAQPLQATPAASLLRAMALAQLGRDEEAYKTLALEYKCSSLVEEVWAEAVFDYLRRRLGETKAYELSYEQLLARAPKDPSIYAGLAEKRFHSGRLPTALKAIEQAIVLDSGNVHYRELRSRIFRALGGKANMARARADALYVLKKQPRYGQDGHGHRYIVVDPAVVWSSEKD
ncbi:MAG: tetratricopeptide repeat protein [Candidatus Obscuribacter sp.]|nr:tetratricopeptide repeat protein [Candidatus Obscuribacter sp.]